MQTLKTFQEAVLIKTGQVIHTCICQKPTNSLLFLIHSETVTKNITSLSLSFGCCTCEIKMIKIGHEFGIMAQHSRFNRFEWKIC